MNLATLDNLLWEVYFPQLVEQWTGESIFDTEADRKSKATMRKKLLAASKDEVRQFLADVAKAERLAKYEALKREFGE